MSYERVRWYGGRVEESYLHPRGILDRLLYQLVPDWTVSVGLVARLPKVDVVKVDDAVRVEVLV